MNPFHLVIFAHCLVALVVPGAFLVWQSRRSKGAKLGGDTLIQAGLLLGPLTVGELVLFRIFGMSIFGWIRLVYLDLYLVLPVLALLVLGAARRRSITGFARIIALLALVPVPVLTYATFVEPFDLRVEEVEIEFAHQGPAPEPFTIALLADLQTDQITDYERGAIATLMEASPDLILISGDIIHVHSGYLEAIPPFRELLGELHAPLGVFMVQGNTDPGEAMATLVQGTDIQLLRNRVVRLEIKGRTIALGGIDLKQFNQPPEFPVIRQLEAADVDLRFLLSHYPDAVLELDVGSSVDLVLAGHTHGGQVVVPFFGPPLTLSSVPRAVAAGGLHEIAGHLIYVSRGIGLERGDAPRLRLFAPPEISILTIK